MAITILGRSTCSICRRVLEERQEIVQFSPCVPKGHRLLEYGDSAMHRSCFDSWEHRDEMDRLQKIATGEIQPAKPPHVTRIAVIGDEDGRSELLDQLRRAGASENDRLRSHTTDT